MFLLTSVLEVWCTLFCYISTSDITRSISFCYFLPLPSQSHFHFQHTLFLSRSKFLLFSSLHWNCPILSMSSLIFHTCHTLKRSFLRDMFGKLLEAWGLKCDVTLIIFVNVNGDAIHTSSLSLHWLTHEALGPLQIHGHNKPFGHYNASDLIAIFTAVIVYSIMFNDYQCPCHSTIELPHTANDIHMTSLNAWHRQAMIRTRP